MEFTLYGKGSAMNWYNSHNDWRLLNLKQAKAFWSHYVYMNDAGTIALADHSIRNLKDPGSTDDGLLTWTYDKLSIANKKGNPLIYVPVYMKDRRTSSVVTCFATVVVMAQASGVQVHEILPELALTEEEVA
jgi:hypothetical protein